MKQLWKPNPKNVTGVGADKKDRLSSNGGRIGKNRPLRIGEEKNENVLCGTFKFQKRVYRSDV